MKLCARTGPYQLFAQQRCWYLVLAMGCFTEDQTHWPVELTAFIKAIMLVSLLVFCNFPSLTIINNSTNLEHFRTLRPPHKGHPLLFQHDPAKLSKFRDKTHLSSLWISTAIRSQGHLRSIGADGQHHCLRQAMDQTNRYKAKHLRGKHHRKV